jgi:signal transduction histidine kinase
VLSGLATATRGLRAWESRRDRTLQGLQPRASVAVLLVAGVGVAVGTVVVVTGSDVLMHPHFNATVRGLAVVLCVASGAYTRWRRPDSALGLLVAGMGLSFSLTSLMAFRAALPFTLGRLALAVFIVFTAYVFVCFPRDRLGDGFERRLMRAAVLASVVVWTLTVALAQQLPIGGPIAQCVGECPRNALQLVDAPASVADTLTVVVSAINVLILAGVTVALVAKARSPNQFLRGAVEPLLWTMGATVAAYGAFTALRDLGAAGTEASGAIVVAGFLSMPVGMLVGQIRGQIFAATRLGRLVSHAGDGAVTPPRVERLIAGVLGDPSLQLLLWSAGRDGYVDVQGAPARLPSQRAERAVTTLMRDGRPLAALVHDRGLDPGQGMTEGVAATALMLLENTRLLGELRASRARIAGAAQQERLRLERDLHDGAQQRLMGIQIKLSLVGDLEEPIEREAVLAEVEQDAAAAVEELRTLARGIYPPLLRERGLSDALSSMAVSTPGTVTVRRLGAVRYPPAIESAVYFSVLEAMQNATKHAGPGANLELSVECVETGVSFTVADAGLGFDERRQPPGLGLVSMRDRMAAVGGELVVTSTPGRGTTVSGSAPPQPSDLQDGR